MSTPPISGYSFDMGMVYRTNRITTSAATGLYKDWNFGFIDKVTTIFDTIPPAGGAARSGVAPAAPPPPPPLIGINWTSGTGDYRTAAAAGNPPSGSGTWLKANRGFSWFRYWSNGGTYVLDRHRPDGSIMRYALTSTPNVWRPVTFFDPHDNAYNYTYNTDGTIQRLTDPRGIETRFFWTSSMLRTEHWLGATHFTGLDEELGLSSGRITYVKAPSTSYLQIGSNGIYSLTPITNQWQLNIAYDPTLLQITDVTDSRQSNFNILHVAYLSYGGRSRVWTQTDMNPGSHLFAYGTAANGNLLTTYTDPLGNAYDFEVSTLDGIPRKYTVTPSATTGRPRAAAGDTPEPTSLTWLFDASLCGCGEITYIKYPSGREYNLAYDDLGNCISWSTLSPTGIGTDTYSWTFNGLDKGSRPLTYSPPGSPTSTAGKSYSYVWIARTNGIWGQKPNRVVILTTPVTTFNGTQTLTSTVDLDTLGRQVDYIDTGGTTYDFVYNTTSPANGLLARVERRAVAGLGTQKIVITQDDLGRVTQISRGTDGNFATTVFINDALGRTITASITPGAGQPAMVSQYFRDAFENVAVILNNNLDYNGQGPKYDDGSGTPRPNVRKEYHYWYDRLTDAYSDRRGLPDPEDQVTPTGGSNPWLLHHQLTYDVGGRVDTVALPNGAHTKYVMDGYGTLYKTIGDEGAGGLNQDMGRRYFDVDLMPSEIRRFVKVNGATTTASTLFTRNQAGKGFINQVTQPDGTKTIYTYDQVARTTLTEVFNAGSVRREMVQRLLDQLGRPKSVLHFLLDSNGVTVGSPVETDYIYDLRSQVVEIDAPLGRKAFRTYDEYGRLKTAHDNLSSTSGQWNEVELQYVAGRDLVAASITKLFEEADDATPPTGTLKQYRTEFDYDTLGRAVTSRRKGLVGGNQAALVSTYAYNSLGMLAYYQEPQQQGDANQYSRSVFDATGRWVQFAKHGSASSEILLRSEYLDAQSGTKLTATNQYDGRGFLTHTDYDAIYRLQEIHRPGYAAGSPAHKTALSYDVGSQIDTIVDGNQSSILYAHDVAGRVLGRTVTPGGGVSLLATKEAFAYDSIGRLTHLETDMCAGPTPSLMASVDLDKDTLRRLSKESYKYAGTGSTTFDVCSGYTFAGGPTAGDPSFRRSLTYPSGMQVATDPDAVGRLERVNLTPPGGTQFSLAQFRYAGGNVFHRQLTLGAGGQTIDTTTAYDEYRRLSLQQHQIGNNAPLDKFQYTWDSGDNLVRRKHDEVSGAAGDLFRADPLHRVDGVKLGVSSATIDGTYAAAASAKEVTYGLDAGQNRSSVTVQLAGQNPQTTNYTTEASSSRYSQVGGVAPLYDGEGSLLFDGSFYYMYDFRNRLSEVYVATDVGAAPMVNGLPGPLAAATAARIRASDLQGGAAQLWSRASGDLMNYARQVAPLSSSVQVTPITATGPGAPPAPTFTLTLVALYGYDPCNRRVARNFNGDDFRYAYDGWREVEEMKIVSGTVSDRKASVWGHGVGELLSFQRKLGGTWTSYYPIQDEQGSVVRLLNSSGGTVERVEYDPYGKASFYYGGTGAAQTVSQVGDPWSYATGRLDNETGLVYLRNRHLNVVVGRFETPDMLSVDTDTSNLRNVYAYVGNAAPKLVDPLGLCAFPSPFGASGGTGMGFGFDASTAFQNDTQGQGGDGQGQGQGQGQGGEKDKKCKPRKSKADEWIAELEYEDWLSELRAVGMGGGPIVCSGGDPSSPGDPGLQRDRELRRQGMMQYQDGLVKDLAAMGSAVLSLPVFGASSLVGACFRCAAGPTRVFWTGGAAASQAAHDFAARVGGQTINDVPVGGLAEDITHGMSWEEAKPFWDAASRDFASGAGDYAYVFAGCDGWSSIPDAGTFATVEYDTLLDNGTHLIFVFLGG